MEVILITPNPKYESLIQSNKIIESTNVDIVGLIETQVFLNQHYNISFYCIKNNFPYQFHCPLKISKHLLDRNEGAVQLSISNGMHFKIQEDTDTLDILSNVQSSLQGVQSEQNVVFTLKFWEIKIRLCILNEVPQENRIKDAINEMQATLQDSSTTTPRISKVVLYIDDSNYEQFLSWSQNEGDFFDFQLHEKLSHEYLSLKQEIDNQKNSFRNKIKMVEAILGQNINIDKLLSQEKQENQEYKRLRQTFETIKNIDNVLIDQERKLELRSSQLKQKRAQKHRTHYENAKKFVKKKSQINQLIKQVELLKYNVKRVSEIKEKFNSKRNFECSSTIKSILEQSAEKSRSIVNHMFLPCSPGRKTSNFNKNKLKSYVSLHKSQNRKLQSYQKALKNKVALFQNSHTQKLSRETIKTNIESEMSIYEELLIKIADYCQNNNALMIQIKDKISNVNKSINVEIDKKLKLNNNSECIDTLLQQSKCVNKNKIEWGQQQFVVLNQILKNKPDYRNYISKCKQNINKNTNSKCERVSNRSINLILDDQKFRISQASIQNSRKNSMNANNKIQSTKKLTKSKINFTYEQKKQGQHRI